MGFQIGSRQGIRPRRERAADVPAGRSVVRRGKGNRTGRPTSVQIGQIVERTGNGVSQIHHRFLSRRRRYLKIKKQKKDKKTKKQKTKYKINRNEINTSRVANEMN